MLMILCYVVYVASKEKGKRRRRETKDDKECALPLVVTKNKKGRGKGHSKLTKGRVGFKMKTKKSDGKGEGEKEKKDDQSSPSSLRHFHIRLLAIVPDLHLFLFNCLSSSIVYLLPFVNFLFSHSFFSSHRQYIPFLTLLKVIPLSFSIYTLLFQFIPTPPSLGGCFYNYVPPRPQPTTEQKTTIPAATTTTGSLRRATKTAGQAIPTPFTHRQQ
ncbi:MAG: hypothetical protein JOS17DRAFT_745452 [Linnemannia elongata]|nr:MAG: hypothetical protein JOS17DRAFT_745452 [Linnemannia elongata]